MRKRSGSAKGGTREQKMDGMVQRLKYKIKMRDGMMGDLIVRTELSFV